MTWMLGALTAGCSGLHSIVPPENTDQVKLTEWQQVKLLPGVDYYGISGVAGTATSIAPTAATLYVVGAGGTMLQGDGQKFTLLPNVTTSDLHAVHVASAQRVYAAGANGTVVVYDGTSWQTQNTGTTAQLEGIWGDDSEAFAVGAGGVALHYDGKTWAIVATATPDNLYAVARVGQETIAVGSLGTVARWTGTDFNRTPIGNYSETLAGITTSNAGTYVSGLDGALFQYKGSQFTSITGLPSVFVRAAAGPGDGDVFAVGWDGLIARLHGGNFLVYPPGAGDTTAATWLSGVWCRDATHCWIVGASGTLLAGPPPYDPAPAGTTSGSAR
jgi:hypothetical protein